MQDGEIFKRIAAWEKDHFSKLDEKTRSTYIGDLKSKSADLKALKDKILVRQANELKIWRHNADIAQLNWRIKYLSSLSATLN